MAAENMQIWVTMCLFVMVFKIINSAEGLNVGVVVDLNTRIGKEQKVGMEIAVEEYNRNISNQNLSVSLHFGSSNVGNPLQATYSGIELIKEKKVEVIIGTETWQETTLLAEVGEQHQVALLSLATPPVSPYLEISSQWPPLLVKMNRNFTAQIKCVASLIGFYGWSRVVAVYGDDGFDIGGISSMLDLFTQALHGVGSKIEYHLALPPLAFMSSNPKEVITQKLVKVLGTQSRVFVVLSSSLPVAIHLFREANNMGLMGRDSVWITTNSIANFLDSVNSSVISSMEGTLGVKSYYDEDTSDFKDFRSKFLLRFLSQHPLEEDFHPSIHALRAYDAIKTITTTLEQMQQTTNFPNKFMEQISSLQFQGLSGMISFKNGELQEDGGEQLRVVNVFGKGYKELDFWSAPNKSFFQRLNDRGTLDQVMFHGTVNWPGDVRHVPKGWGVPMNAKPLKIGVPGRTTFDKFVKVETEGNPNRTIYSGFCIDVFLEVVKILEESYDFPYEFEAFYGTYDELVDCVHNKTYDAVVGDITILANRSQHVDFTQPYTRSGLSIIVPWKSHEWRKAWMFRKPFSWPLWLVTLALLMYTAFVVWWMEKRHNPEFGDSSKDQLSTALWFTFSSVFFAHKETIRSNYTRIAVVAWLFVVYVLTQSYTANLTSILTVPLLEPKVKDIEWMIKTNAKVGCDGDSFVLDYLQTVLGFQPQNIISVNSEYAYPEFFSNGSIVAAFIEHPYAKVFLRQYCNCFTQTNNNFRFGGQGFVFQKGSPLVADVSKAILELSENGILKQLNDKWFSPSAECLSSTNVDNKSERLGIEVFSILYIFSGTIITVCFLLFAKQWLKSMRRFPRRSVSLIRNNLSLNNVVNFAGLLKRKETATQQNRLYSLPKAPDPNERALIRKCNTTGIGRNVSPNSPSLVEMETLVFNRRYSI